MTMELAFNIALGLISTLLTFVIKNLFDRLKEDREKLTKLKEDTGKEITEIKLSYVNREESLRNQDFISTQLREITGKLDKLSDKLDSKVDK